MKLRAFRHSQKGAILTGAVLIFSIMMITFSVVLLQPIRTTSANTHLNGRKICATYLAEGGLKYGLYSLSQNQIKLKDGKGEIEKKMTEKNRQGKFVFKVAVDTSKLKLYNIQVVGKTSGVEAHIKTIYQKVNGRWLRKKFTLSYKLIK